LWNSAPEKSVETDMYYGSRYLADEKRFLKRDYLPGKLDEVGRT
jgi:hypothetical protein